MDATEKATIISGSAALLGPDLQPVDPATVVVVAGRIVYAGSPPAAPRPEGAGEVDASGLLVVPGFIDAHVHIGLADPREVLRRGVTTARDLGWPPERIRPLVASSSGASFDGPLLIAAGPMLTAVGGYPTRAGWAPAGTGFEVASPGAAESAVDEAAAGGAAVIKVALDPAAGPTLDSEILSAIADAAHARGLKITAHIHGLEELDKAVACGVDELAHMLMSAERIPPELLTHMADSGMTIVPTLSIRYGRDRGVAIANLTAWIEIGGRVVYGTDLGNAGPRPGIDRREIKAMAEAGMSGREIVASATTASAAWLGLGGKGALSAGADADVVAVPRSALHDPLELARVKMVWRGGRRAR